MHHRDLLHFFRNLAFYYGSRQRRMDLSLSFRGSGSLRELNPVSLKRISIHLLLKRKKEIEVKVIN